MKVKLSHDYPTIEGMIYKDTKLRDDKSEYKLKEHSEKVKGLDSMGKIVWVPKKMLKRDG